MGRYSSCTGALRNESGLRERKYGVYYECTMSVVLQYQDYRDMQLFLKSRLYDKISIVNLNK